MARSPATPPRPTPPPAPARPPRRPREVPPGLARERTQLAWSRTVIAFAAVGGALLKTNIAAGLAVAGMGVLIWGLCQILPRATPGPQPVRMLIVAAGVTAVSVVALVVAFVAR